MSVADKIANEDADNTGSLFEFDLSAMHVHDILDREPVSGRYYPQTPADWLAQVLICLRRAVTGTDADRRRAVKSMDEMIELCFMRSPTYYAALNLYTLEHRGAIKGARSSWEHIAAEIERSTGESFAYPGWTPGRIGGRDSGVRGQGETSQAPDQSATVADSTGEDESARDRSANDWRLKFRAFTEQLQSILDDERTPDEVRDLFENAVVEANNQLGNPFASLDEITKLAERLAPEKGGDA